MIISGGSIDEAFALQMMSDIQPECTIGVDRGLEFLYRNQVLPTYIVGDFDSVQPEIIEYYKNETDVPIREFNPVKDASDTEIAVRLAIALGVENLYLIGATGTRLDHVQANIQVLKIAHDAGVNACILDAYNKISLIDGEKILSKESQFGTYFSVFPLGSTVENLSIEGAKYPLHYHTLTPDDSLCVSNQIQREEVKITCTEGLMILMETRDTKKS